MHIGANTGEITVRKRSVAGTHTCGKQQMQKPEAELRIKNVYLTFKGKWAQRASTGGSGKLGGGDRMSQPVSSDGKQQKSSTKVRPNLPLVMNFTRGHKAQ